MIEWAFGDYQSAVNTRTDARGIRWGAARGAAAAPFKEGADRIKHLADPCETEALRSLPLESSVDVETLRVAAPASAAGEMLTEARHPGANHANANSKVEGFFLSRRSPTS